MDIVRRQIGYNFSIRKGAIEYIVVHDTGNPGVGANAQSHYLYFNGGNRSSSADIFVDDSAAWYVNDYIKYYTWHCGDGRGRYGITNANSIGVEICINADGNRNRALANAAEVVRGLMKELNIPADRVVRHYDASRKCCPASMSGDNWSAWYAFKKMLLEEELTMTQYEELKKAVADLTETVKQLAIEVHNLKNPMIYNYIDKNMPEWAREAVRWAVDNGIIQGDGNGLALTDEKLWQLVVLKRTMDKNKG